MQILNHLKIFKKMKKSHTLLIGSLLIFCGILSLSWNYLALLRDEIFSDMKISMMNVVPVDEIDGETLASEDGTSFTEEGKPIDYSKYLGVLEIRKIGLKRGFYNVGNRYNDIKYNVTMVGGSDLPDVPNGNLILMAHSGDSYISYFAYLYKLNIGDECVVTYNNRQYHYTIVNIYDVIKNGVVTIKRDRGKNTLTMITCTKDNDSLQTVYIAEYVG